MTKRSGMSSWLSTEARARRMRQDRIPRRDHGDDGQARAARHRAWRPRSWAAIRANCVQRKEQAETERPDRAEDRDVLASRPSSTQGQKRCVGPLAFAAR